MQSMKIGNVNEKYLEGKTYIKTFLWIQTYHIFLCIILRVFTFLDFYTNILLYEELGKITSYIIRLILEIKITILSKTDSQTFQDICHHLKRKFRSESFILNNLFSFHLFTVKYL